MNGVELKVEGLDKLRRRLEPSRLVWGPAKAQLRQVGIKGVELARVTGPKGTTGQLTAKITYQVNSKPMPRWVVIKTTARRKSFKYPRLLEYVAKYGHVGWLISVADDLKGYARAAMGRAAADIKSRWRA